MPAAFRTHSRQHGARHRKEAEGIRIELRANLVLLAFFNRRLIAVASIVDQHVDTAKLLLRERHDGVDLRGVCHVERDAQQTLARIGREIVE
jgi:hypothetical protein